MHVSRGLVATTEILYWQLRYRYTKVEGPLV